MKYNKYAVQDSNGNFIKYGTAYSNEIMFTNSLYDPHLWDRKKDAEKLSEWLVRYEGRTNLSVVLI